MQRVVIVGAGFGGMAVVRALRRADAAVTLIDRENHHTFQPLLYQAATAALSTADIAWPARSVLNRQKNVRVVMAEVTGIDVAAKRVLTDGPAFDYDHLVLATDSTHCYFGHEAWARFAPGLKGIADADVIRARILLAFERAELADTAARARLLTFVVIGGGSTGVEMAGAIAEIARDTLRHDFRAIDPGTARIVLVEAGPRVLPSLPNSLSRYAMFALRRIGVEIRVGVRVTDCDVEGVATSGGRIEAATLIWAAGVRASPAAAWIDARADQHDRVLVSADLSVPGHSEIHVVGDTASLVRADGAPVPGVAPAAKQMGAFVGRHIAALAAGKQDEPGTFLYRYQGDLATIGRKAAVVRIGRVKLTGFVAWMVWGLVHICFLITRRDRIVVAFDWLWNYMTFQRGARVVVRPGVYVP